MGASGSPQAALETATWPELRRLVKEEPSAGIAFQTAPGIRTSFEFTTGGINTAIYLQWLRSTCLSNGVVFKRAALEHVTDAVRPPTSGIARLVINCTG
ncbi:D-amino acid oxidase [Sporothrix stenoceras]|uniref:D-amino acid oxidase n=1 Tax=Sporothrix stenoceras TaxID=5173 RepID=A0ABR3Z4E5_9PEZI